METIKNSQPALSILIVEDDSITCEMIGRIIAQEFPNVIINIAESGEQGVELFKKHLSDIVITDINMPKYDGFQMACKIRLIKDDIHFIVLTGHSEKAQMEKFNEIGITDYLVKPIDFGKLFAAIEKCIAEINMKLQ